MHHQNRRADFIGILQDRLIDKALAADDVPAAVGVERSCVIPASGLVIIVIVFDKERCIFRQRIDHAAAQLVFTGLQILESLGAHGGSLLISGFLTVLRIEVSLRVHTGHVVHGGSHGRLDAGIQRGRIKSHTAPAANPDDADAVRIDLLIQGEEVHRRHEIFGVDIGGGHVTHITAALASEGRIKSDRQETALCHRLRVESGALFLDGAERSADGDCGKLARCILWNIHVCRQRNAISIDKGHLAVIDFFTLRESLIPFVCEYKFFYSDHGLYLLISCFFTDSFLLSAGSGSPGSPLFADSREAPPSGCTGISGSAGSGPPYLRLRRVFLLFPVPRFRSLHPKGS